MMGVDGLASVLFAWAAVTKYHRQFIFSWFWRSKIKVSVEVVLRLLSLTCQWLPSCCVLTGFPSVCAQPWCLSLS